MTTATLLINEKVFVPVKEAAVEFGYSTDHLTRLAKTRKIIALQVGRRWFVQRDFLSSYVLEQQLEATARQSDLSHRRRTELALRSAVLQSQTSAVWISHTSHRAALAVSSFLLLASVYAGSMLLDELPLTAAVVVANPVATASTATTAITPVFVDAATRVQVDHSRVVAKPQITSEWTHITP